MEENNGSSFQEKAMEFVRHNILFVGVIVFGFTLLIIGLFQYFASKSSDNVEFVPQTKGVAASDAASGSTTTNGSISIDVEGQVQKPGIYNLPQGSRIQDALIAAGGMNSKADRVYVSKHINLAQKLVDGGKVYIVGVGEAVDSAIVVQSSSNSDTSQAYGENSTLININTATLEQLDTLPKIGPVTAQKIVTGRPYASKEELVGKKVLTQKTFDGLKDKITAE